MLGICMKSRIEWLDISSMQLITSNQTEIRPKMDTNVTKCLDSIMAPQSL